MSAQIEFNDKCTGYLEDRDMEDWTPCRCPVCHGFLASDIYQDPLVCKKCGSELVAIPHSEKYKESDDWDGAEGRICVVTERHEIKQRIKITKKEKETAKQWKGWL